MATSVTLSSNTPRINFFDEVIPFLEQKSRFRALFSEAAGGDGIGIIAPAGEKYLTFRIDAVSPIVGNPLPPGVSAVDNPSSIFFRTVQGTRYGFAQSAELQKYQISQTPFSQEALAIRELGYWAGRVFDQVLVWACSAGHEAMDTTSASTVWNSLTGLTNFKTVVNTSNIGNDDVDTNTALATGEYAIDSRQVNVVFAGPESGIQSTTTGNTWDNLTYDMHRLQPETFYYLYDYLMQRGIAPTVMKVDGDSQEVWIALLTSSAIMEIRRHPTFARWAQESVVESYNQDLWKPKKLITIQNIVLYPVMHNVSMFTGRTPLRSELSEDGRFWKREGLVLGSQAVGISIYDADYSTVTHANEDDGGRSPKLVMDFIMGARQIERVDNVNGSAVPRNQVCSLCYVDTRVG